MHDKFRKRYRLTPASGRLRHQIALEAALKQALENTRLQTEVTELRRQVSDDQSAAFFLWGKSEGNCLNGRVQWVDLLVTMPARSRRQVSMKRAGLHGHFPISACGPQAKSDDVSFCAAGRPDRC